MVIQSPNVVVDGKTLQSDVQPFVLDGRTYVGLRAVGEALGAEVGWELETQTVTLERNGKIITTVVNSMNLTVDGVTKQVDAPSMIVNNRVVVPIRFIAEGFGAVVRWNGNANTASIYLNTTAPAVTETTPVVTPAKPVVQNNSEWMNDASLSPLFKQVLASVPGIERVRDTPCFKYTDSQMKPEVYFVDSKKINRFLIQVDYSMGLEGYDFEPRLVQVLTSAFTPVVGETKAKEIIRIMDDMTIGQEVKYGNVRISMSNRPITVYVSY